MKLTEPWSSDDRVRVWRPLAVPGLELGVKDSPVALEFPPSLVFDYRIVLNGRGRGRVRFGRESYQIPDVRDVMFLQHPGEAFQGFFDGPSGASGACLGFSEELIAELLGERPRSPWRFARMIPSGPINAVLVTRTRAALRVFAEPASLLERQGRLVELIDVVRRATVTSARGSLWPTERPGAERRAVGTVRQLFQELPGTDHSISELARLTGLNPRYLIRSFRQATGLTPHRYLTAVRVQRAKDLIVDQRPLRDVATELGFADQAHFTRVFKAYVRVSPGEFRRLSSATDG